MATFMTAALPEAVAEAAAPEPLDEAAAAPEPEPDEVALAVSDAPELALLERVAVEDADALLLEDRPEEAF